MSSTHMKMMIAFRRVSTPMAPMVNSTADSASDSASIDLSPASENHGADDGDEQQNARQLEREQVFIEERLCHTPDRAQCPHRFGIVSAAGREWLWKTLARECHDLCEQREPEQPGREASPLPSRVSDLR